MSVTKEHRLDAIKPVAPDDGVASAMRPLVQALVGARPSVRLEFWDGTGVGPTDGPATVRVESPDALRRIMWSPNELGVSRAYVAGDITVEGDIMKAIEALRDTSPDDLDFGPRAAIGALSAARKLGVLGRPLPAPPEEAKPRGRRHSKQRDAGVISHHYDVGNDFYRIVLGPAMTYSCAHFAREDMTLAEAQASKHELICRKLGLQEHQGARLLDVGCGWGSMALHAAQRYGAQVVGITISQEQADGARQRVEEAGLSKLIEIRLLDYRDLRGDQYDAISSIGMFEHVGVARTEEYFGVLRSLLGPGGRLLNHAISSVRGSRIGRRTFMGRYVFPDGELADVGDVVLAMEYAGFEVRDVESLREHYAQTLRRWVANLESDWDRAVALAGQSRARIWRLYMAGSAVGFEDGGLGVHQVLGVVADRGGLSGMPRTRDAWSAEIA